MAQSDKLMGDRIYRDLFAVILDQELDAGARLNIDALSRSLNVSQTPIRQALARLLAEGIVINRPNAGYSVSPLPSRAHLLEILAFRLMFEPTLARMAANRINPDGVMRLEKNIAELEATAVPPNFSQFNFFEADRELHEILADLSGNAAALRTVSHLITTSSVFRHRYAPPIPNEILQEHRDIASAVMQGRADGAAELMTRHLQISYERVAAVIVPDQDDQQPSTAP